MRLSGLGRLKGSAVTVAALATAVTAVVVPSDRAATQQTSAAEPAGQSDACLIVDTDVGLDDFRAVAALLPQREVRAVVVTEGVAGVSRGSTAISMFLGAGTQTPPVIPGLASPNPPEFDWLPVARAGAERINNFLAAAIPFDGNAAALSRDVRDAVRGCWRVDVLVLGPWTSFNRYADELGSNVHVTVSGLSYAEDHVDSFNCVYDVAACKAAVPLLRKVRSVVYVDLPQYSGEDPTYDPTAEMIAQYGPKGVSALQRVSHQVDPSGWAGTRLWDDAASLYLLKPQVFVRRGAHFEPGVSEATFRNLLVAVTNG
jgi:inosine-uridine nucleoside N-ribohydrolase